MFRADLGRAVAALVVGLFGVAGQAFAASAGVLGSYKAAAFSMADSIEMAMPVFLENSGQNIEPEISTISPDGSSVIVVTKSGDLASGTNIYRMLLFDIQALRAQGASSRGELPTSRVVYRLVTPDRAYVYNAHYPWPIRRIKWEAPDTITFISGAGDDAGDVYRLSLSSGKATRLTWSAGAVEDYAISRDGKTVVYLARTIRKCNFAFPEPELVGEGSFMEHIGTCNNPAAEQSFPYGRTRLFRKVSDQSGAAAISKEFAWFPEMGRLEVSPDGRWATIAAAQDRPVPDDWKGYFVSNKDVDFWKEVGGAKRMDGLQGRRLSRASEFLLSDLRKGTTRSILNAPTAQWGYYAVSHWLPDSRHVILTHTNIPPAKPERAGRIHIIEYDTSTGKILPILSFEDPIANIARGVDETVTRTRLVGGKLYVTVRGGGLDPAQLRSTLLASKETTLVFSRDSKRWRREANVAQPDELRPEVSVFVKQGLNTPPDYFIRFASTGAELRLTDLNPQLRALRMASARVWKWSAGGRQREGGLLLPPDYQVGIRYPLVIQIHCFDDHVFLRDGGDPDETAPFAARALSSAGFAVLQIAPMGDGADGLVTDVEAAVMSLQRAGLIDASRIGLVGWSAGGKPVLTLLTDSKIKFQAAVVSDAAASSPMMYFLSAGWPSDTVGEIERRTKGVPWGTGLMAWARNNPVFKLDHTSAALRIESFNRLATVAWYDVFTIMRRLRNPVEYLVYDGASHAPQNPVQRYSSSQGTIDWMMFWLQGKERQGPGTSKQYDRWRTMRAERSKAKEAGGVTSSF